MIKEAYVSFELAKSLKEEGFNPQPDMDAWICCMYDENGKIHWGMYDSKWYFRITHQLALQWLREVHNIVIIIEPHAYDYVNQKNKSYSCSLWVGDNYYEYIESKAYPSYEEAVEAVLRYCLKNLI